MTGISANNKTDDRDNSPEGEPLWTTLAGADDSGYRSRKQENKAEPPNWVEIGTLVVLLLTLVAAAYAAYEAGRLAVDTERALDDGQRAIEIQNRSWIGATEARLLEPPAIGKPIHAVVIYTNSGRSPATNLAIAQKLLIVGNTGIGSDWSTTFPPNDSCEVLKNNTGGDVIFPGANYNTGIPVSVSGTYPPELASMKRLLVWQGCFTYNSLGHRHKTGWCYFLRPYPSVPFAQWGWQSCITGNYAD